MIIHTRYQWNQHDHIVSTSLHKTKPERKIYEEKKIVRIIGRKLYIIIFVIHSFVESQGFYGFVCFGFGVG